MSSAQLGGHTHTHTHTHTHRVINTAQVLVVGLLNAGHELRRRLLREQPGLLPLLGLDVAVDRLMDAINLLVPKLGLTLSSDGFLSNRI